MPVLRDILTDGAALLFCLGALALATFVFAHSNSGAPILFADENTNLNAARSAAQEGEPQKPEPLPPSVSISVPFAAQAPRGEWRAPWDEACEEASVLMVMAWLWQEHVLKR